MKWTPTIALNIPLIAQKGPFNQPECYPSTKLKGHSALLPQLQSTEIAPAGSDL